MDRTRCAPNARHRNALRRKRLKNPAATRKATSLPAEIRNGRYRVRVQSGALPGVTLREHASTRTLPAPVRKTAHKTKARHAPRYRVLFHDDEITTMEFVVDVLGRFFGHDLLTATKIMLEIHNKGIGLAGIYPLEIAELKQEQTISAARPLYPLAVTIEPDD